MDLIGNDAMQDEEAMRKMWGDSMTVCNCSTARITYDDFLLIMKGQTKEGESHAGDDTLLHVTPEESALEHTSKPAGDSQGLTEGGTPTIVPLSPILTARHSVEMPLSMDDDGDLPTSLPMIPTRPPLTPNSPYGRASPKLVPGDLCHGGEEGLDAALTSSNPELIKVVPFPSLPRPGIVGRQKSRSMNESQMTTTMDLRTAFPANALRALALPETDPERRDSVINKNNTVLQANRKLYRAHRQMRFSVMDASKRFEEQQARHARDILIAQQEEKHNSGGKGAAGLIMRRVENKTIPSEAVMKLLERNRKEQQDLMEKASRLGGRGRRNRRKTNSDIVGMLGSLSQDEMTNISTLVTQAKPQGLDWTPAPIPHVIETLPMDDPDDDSNLRPATVPGEFRKVKDPFGAHGRYSAMCLDDGVN